VDTSRKGKIERKTMKIFSERLNQTIKSYAMTNARSKNTNLPASFFEILTGENHTDFQNSFTNMCGYI
jgi:hypothetical protein